MNDSSKLKEGSMSEEVSDLLSSAYLQRSINNTYTTILQDQVNAKNQRLSLMTKQLNSIAKI